MPAPVMVKRSVETVATGDVAVAPMRRAGGSTMAWIVAIVALGA
jgi:hypothetical protein